MNKALLFFSILALNTNSLFAVCPYIECSDTSKAASEAVVDRIKINGQLISTAMSAFEKNLDFEIAADNLVLESLNKQLTQLQETKVILLEVDSLLKQKIKLLKNIKEKH